MEWFELADPDVADSPALLVFPERVNYNIAKATGMVGDIARLRPHVKTHKSAAVTKLLLGAGITNYKCATIAEAEMLAMCKATDVLLAYQPNGPKADRFIQLIIAYPEIKLSCLVDNYNSAKNLSEKALTAGHVANVYIDVNVGMNRTGIAIDDVENLAAEINNLKGLHFAGLHAYDGHIHDSDMNVRNRAANEIYNQLSAIKTNLAKYANSSIDIVAGGTPTFPFYSSKTDVTSSPGTFVYWDAGYGEHFAEQQFLPAAVLMTRVVSIPGNNKVCLDLGHKSVASESSIDKRVRFLNAPDLKVISHSEEHLVCETTTDHTYQIGDTIYALPYHVCPTVALYDKTIVIEDNKVYDEWPVTARNRKIKI